MFPPFYTASGKTTRVGREVFINSEATNATTWRIVPEAAYASEDLNYNNSFSRANREQDDPSARPAVNGKCGYPADYEVVFLGYPVWWGKALKVIFTFLENHDLTSKTVVPFCTSHSRGVGSSDTDLHRSASEAKWKHGRRFSGNESKETIENWIKNMDLNFNKNTNVGIFDLSEGTNGNAPTVRLRYADYRAGHLQLHGSTCFNSVKSALERASVVNDTNPGMFWHKIGGAVAVEPDEIK